MNTIVTTTATFTAPMIQAFLDFIAPDLGQVIEMPNGKVLIQLSEGDKLVAWISEGATPAPWNVQSMRLKHLLPEELATVRELCANPSKAKVLGYVA
jgi:hypothetical protein